MQRIRDRIEAHRSQIGGATEPSEQCRTCKGSGKISRKYSEGVAVISLGDERLAPQRTVIYIILAVVAFLATTISCVIFLYPRPVTGVSKTLQILEAKIARNETKLKLGITVQAHNQNFLASHVDAVVTSVQRIRDRIEAHRSQIGGATEPSEQCRTCKGSGKISRKYSEGVAVISLGDERLAPQRTVIYIILAVVAFLATTISCVIFLYPRPVTGVSKTLQILEAKIARNETKLKLGITVQAHNQNFLASHVDAVVTSVQLINETTISNRCYRFMVSTKILLCCGTFLTASQLYLVSGKSMAPTINHSPTTHSLLLLDRLTPLLGLYQPHHGDIVVFTRPETTRSVVKRVARVEGEVKGGVVVRKEQFWAQGDNRRCSVDSCDYGPVPVRSLPGDTTSCYTDVTCAVCVQVSCLMTPLNELPRGHRTNIHATNCLSGWTCTGKVPDEVLEWIRQGRPYSGYELEEEGPDLILTLHPNTTLTLQRTDLQKVLPVILTELSLREPKRELNGKQELKQKRKEQKRKELFEKSTLKNVALKIAYFGWKYSGLARQLNTPDTIEEILLQACEKCCLIYEAKGYRITRCGRTDKGVSAFSQVISLYLRSKEGEDYDYPAMLNTVLPSHIRILGWTYVGLEFDARFQVLFRSYRYFFPLCNMNLDVMRGACQRFLGTHNFRGFCKADRTQKDPNYIRTISYMAVDLVTENTKNPKLSIYSITILGHAFLWHQIRNMVSILFRVGLGLDPPSLISSMLERGVKYNYGMASEIPLVLFDCEFENVKWNKAELDLGKIWFEAVVQTTLIETLMGDGDLKCVEGFTTLTCLTLCHGGFDLGVWVGARVVGVFMVSTKTLLCCGTCLTASQLYLVSGKSMAPSINHSPTTHSLLLLDRLTPLLGLYQPHHGDIVVFTRPETTRSVVKRVAGVEGEIKGGVVVGKGQFWAQGDNRRCSVDSCDYGPVPVRSILARCCLVIPLPVTVTSRVQSVYRYLSIDLTLFSFRSKSENGCHNLQFCGSCCYISIPIRVDLYGEGYELEEEGTDLILTLHPNTTLTLHRTDLQKVLPLILTELSLREPKRELNGKQELKQKRKEQKRKELFEKSTLKNVALKIAYFGWKYSGLARQLNTPDTIEEILLQACEKCCLIYEAKGYRITRCGRTDKGVSAFSQVISLYLRSKEGDDYDYPAMLNTVLPSHIRILGWTYVGLEFDARFQVLFRSYRYFFPLCNMDLEVMRGACQRFLGTHNFRGFCKADRTQKDPNYIRTISYMAVDLVTENTKNPKLSIYSITILGHAFLWHQIRNMVSILFRVGLGLDPPSLISSMLERGVKYNYGMASEIPLVLFDCEFENVKWNKAELDLGKIWFEAVVQTTLIETLMGDEGRPAKTVIKTTTIRTTAVDVPWQSTRCDVVTRTVSLTIKIHFPRSVGGGYTRYGPLPSPVSGKGNGPAWMDVLDPAHQTPNETESVESGEGGDPARSAPWARPTLTGIHRIHPTNYPTSSDKMLTSSILYSYINTDWGPSFIVNFSQFLDLTQIFIYLTNFLNLKKYNFTRSHSNSLSHSINFSIIHSGSKKWLNSQKKHHGRDFIRAPNKSTILVGNEKCSGPDKMEGELGTNTYWGSRYGLQPILALGQCNTIYTGKIIKGKQFCITLSLSLSLYYISLSCFVDCTAVAHRCISLSLFVRLV
eukprot:sb/3460736/